MGYMAYLGRKTSKKRGSSKKKKEIKKEEKQYKKNIMADRTAMGLIKDVTFTSRLVDAIAMKQAVDSEKAKHFIGEHIKFTRKKYEETKGAKIDISVDGYVEGIYPHFLLLKCKNYKTTVSYKDLILLGIGG